MIVSDKRGRIIVLIGTWNFPMFAAFLAGFSDNAFLLTKNLESTDEMFVTVRLKQMHLTRVVFS